MQVQQLRIVALWLVVIAILLVLSYFLYQFFRLEQIAGRLPEDGTKVRVVERGVSHYYVFWKKMFVVDPPQVREDGLVIVESVPSPLHEKETVVLAAGVGVDRVALGVLKGDDTFEPLLTGGTTKADLLVTKDGVAVVSTRKSIAVAEESLSFPQTEERGGESEVVDTGTASAPSPFVFEGRTDFEATSVLYAVDLKNGTVRVIGSGRNPRLLSDGGILATADDGVVRIDVTSGERSILVPYPGADNFLSAVSNAGEMIAVGGEESGVVDFYEYKNGRVVHLGTFTPRSEPMSIVFLDDTQFIVRYSPEEATLYEVPQGDNAVAMPVVALKLEINQ